MEIPQHVLDYVRSRIDSVEQLEMLLLLKDNAEREWTAEEASRALLTSPVSAASRLAEFHVRGLLKMATREDGVHYQYQPSANEHKTIGDLSEAYSRYPARIITLIYSKPIDKIRTFADSFKLRKDDE